MATATLADALRIAESTSNTGSPRVCTNQSRILTAAFDHVAGFLKQIRSLDFPPSKRKAFVWDETVAVLRRGLHLLRSCRGSDWVVRSLLFEESSEDFHLLCSEIYNSVWLISAYLFQLNPSSSFKSKITDAYKSFLQRKCSSSSLEEAGVSDRRQLMNLALSQDSGSGVAGSEGAKEILCSILLGKQSAINHRDLKLKTHLGHGAYGTVYEAKWLGQRLAVKVFAQGDISFDKELQVLRAHKHPNVLHIAGHSLDPSKGQYWLVMEKMDMDLANYTANYLRKKKHPLPLLLRVEIMLQVATGMAWLHSRNVIHRDLKPENILVQEKDSVLLSIRIADFGVSRPDFITSMISKQTPKKGTRNFMAPEVWTGERYSKKADVYSYGMLCYNLCTGNIPFKDGMDMEQVIRGVRPEIPADCPEFFSLLMQKCWSHDAKMRPAFLEICQRLKDLKARTITGTDSLEEIRAELIEAGSGSGSTLSPSSGSSSSSSAVGLENWKTQATVLETPQIPHRVHDLQPPKPKPAAPQSNGRNDLFEMVKQGFIVNAFEKALSLNDPATVWWLCTKVEHTVLGVFSETMLMTLAEQINTNYTEDTVLKLLWMDEIAGLLLKDVNGWASPRKVRILERVSQNLHGVMAITLPNSELGMKLSNLMEATSMWLERVRVAVSNKGFVGGPQTNSPKGYSEEFAAS